MTKPEDSAFDAAADVETTQAMPSVDIREDLYRTDDDIDRTRVIGATAARPVEARPAFVVEPEPTVVVTDEDEDYAARQRAEERASRDRALGKVARSETPDPVVVAPAKPSTDKFFPSLGLFLLRLVTAAIMGIHGFQKLTDIPATEAFVQSLGLPEPHYLAWGIGVAEVLAAVALVFGVLTRVAGLGIAAVAIGALALVKWGVVNPFVAGKPGFIGELELLLAVVGLALLFVGPGRWSVDGSVAAGRRERKALA